MTPCVCAALLPLLLIGVPVALIFGWTYTSITAALGVSPHMLVVALLVLNISRTGWFKRRVAGMGFAIQHFFTLAISRWRSTSDLRLIVRLGGFGLLIYLMAWATSDFLPLRLYTAMFVSVGSSVDYVTMAVSLAVFFGAMFAVRTTVTGTTSPMSRPADFSGSMTRQRNALLGVFHFTTTWLRRHFTLTFPTIGYTIHGFNVMSLTSSNDPTGAGANTNPRQTSSNVNFRERYATGLAYLFAHRHARAPVAFGFPSG